MQVNGDLSIAHSIDMAVERKAQQLPIGCKNRIRANENEECGNFTLPPSAGVGRRGETMGRQFWSANSKANGEKSHEDNNVEK